MNFQFYCLASTLRGCFRDEGQSPMNSSTHDPSTPLPGTDADLLRAWSGSQSEPAFRELVRRHAGLVLATARRRLGSDSPHAEDAAQQVFVALARKPSRALRSLSLGAWLHRAAVFEAGNLLRGEIRHRTRAVAAASAENPSEHAAPPGAPPSDVPPAWLDAQPHLDAALASLNETDRSFIILHHLEGRAYPEVADRLGCTAAAAQRRGHRALTKLSAQLRRRGVLVPTATLTIGLTPALAPPSASAALATRALALGGAAGTGAGLLTTLFTAPMLGNAAAVLTCAAAFFTVRHFQNQNHVASNKSPVASLPAADPNSAPLKRPPAPPRPAQPEFKVSLPDEQLTEDQLTFITKAKTDAIAAIVWAREKYPATDTLRTFLQSAGQVLADRDLDAADRVLQAASTPREIEVLFGSLLESKLKRDFPAAIAWADRWNLTHEDSPQTPFLQYENWDSGEWRPDLPAALATSRSKEVRDSLIHMESQRLTAENEEGLQPLADLLSGEEQKRVLEYKLSVTLKRGLPGAAEALFSLQPDRLQDTTEIALQCPELVLDYQMSRPKEPNGSHFCDAANQVGVSWARNDPVAAAAWREKYSREDMIHHSMLSLLFLLEGKFQ